MAGVVERELSTAIALAIISSSKAFAVLPVEHHPGGRLERR